MWSHCPALVHYTYHTSHLPFQTAADPSKPGKKTVWMCDKISQIRAFVTASLNVKYLWSYPAFVQRNEGLCCKTWDEERNERADVWLHGLSWEPIWREPLTLLYKMSRVNGPIKHLVMHREIISVWNLYLSVKSVAFGTFGEPSDHVLKAINGNLNLWWVVSRICLSVLKGHWKKKYNSIVMFKLE